MVDIASFQVSVALSKLSLYNLVNISTDQKRLLYIMLYHVFEHFSEAKALSIIPAF